jgi:glycosyltransferase involved in cell wall biosynthesis
MSKSHDIAPGRTKPKVIFVNRFFYPDHSATSQILCDLAFYLAQSGEQVHVIASRRLYDDPSAKLPAQETISGVAIHRVATASFSRHSLIGRAFDDASFLASSAFALLRYAKRGDVVVAKTDPPMLSVLTGALSRLRGFKTINWLQDVYPEIAIELGVSALKGHVGKMLTALRNRSLRNATMNVAVGEAMAQHMLGSGVESKRLRTIHNWTDDEQILPSDACENPLRRKWSLEGKFVVAYSGNLGRAHDFETLFGAATRLRERSNIAFLVVGGGRGFSDLRDRVQAHALSNFRFEPYQPRDQLPVSLGVADIHWLSLKPSLDGLVFPSKFYGVAAAGRPIIVIGSAEGELSNLVKRYDCGVCVEPGMDEELANAILALAEDGLRVRRLGENARSMLDRTFTKLRALEKWRAVLGSSVG